MLSDLRESGAIEQDADSVIFIHRPEYYNQQKYEYQGREIDSKGVMIQIIAKNRHGAIVDVITKWNESTTSISNWGENELDKVLAQTTMSLDSNNGIKDFSPNDYQASRFHIYTKAPLIKFHHLKEPLCIESNRPYIHSHHIREAVCLLILQNPYLDKFQ